MNQARPKAQVTKTEKWKTAHRAAMRRRSDVEKRLKAFLEAIEAVKA